MEMKEMKENMDTTSWQNGAKGHIAQVRLANGQQCATGVAHEQDTYDWMSYANGVHANKTHVLWSSTHYNQHSVAIVIAVVIATQNNSEQWEGGSPDALQADGFPQGATSLQAALGHWEASQGQ